MTKLKLVPYSGGGYQQAGIGGIFVGSNISKSRKIPEFNQLSSSSETRIPRRPSLSNLKIEGEKHKIIKLKRLNTLIQQDHVATSPPPF